MSQPSNQVTSGSRKTGSGPAETVTPSAPGALPLIGHLLPLVRDRFTFLRALPAHGDLVRVGIGPWQVLVVTDAELSRQLLLDDRTFDKGGPLFDRTRETGGNGLINCPHRDHRRQRRLVQPSFHRDRMAGYAEIMCRQIGAVVGSWQAGQTIEVLPQVQNITARNTLGALFSESLPPAEVDALVGDIGTILTGLVRRMLMPGRLDRLPTPGNRKYARAQHHLDRVLTQLITEYREAGSDRDDLLSALLGARDPKDETRGLSDSEIRDQVVNFFVAGTETTADAVSWALHLLSRHPDIERRLHEETARCRPTATYQDLPHLTLTRGVILESLRLYPPVPLLTRLATRDTRLGAHHIPAGSVVVYSPYCVQHQSGLYPEPDRFDPDRWDGTTYPHQPRAPFLAFGAGPRQCVGDTFAMTQATLILATIAAHWYLHPTSRRKPRPALSAVLSPRTLRMQCHALPQPTGESAL